MKLKFHLSLLIFLWTSENEYSATQCEQGLCPRCGIANTNHDETLCMNYTSWTNSNHCQKLTVMCSYDYIDDHQPFGSPACSCDLTQEQFCQAFIQLPSAATSTSSNATPSETDEGSIAPLTTHQNSDTNSAQDTTHHCQCEAILGILGSLVGLLSVLLTIVITSWVWMYWTMKKRVSFAINPLSHYNSASMDSNNTAQETIIIPQKQQYSTMFATSYNSQTAACTCNYIHQTTFKAGQNNIQGEKNDSEEIDSCEHNYHVLDQPIRDNDYEELDKYEKMGWSQQEEDVTYTLDGPAMEGGGTRDSEGEQVS